MRADTWTKATVGDICRFSNGYGFKAKEWAKSGLPIIRIQNLNGSTKFNYYHGDPPRKNIVVEPGDLLFAWAGVKGVSFGPKIWTGPKGLLNQHIYKIKPNHDVDINWLYGALETVTRRIEANAHGFKSSLLHVKKSDITEQVVFLPPLDIQKNIAEIVHTWDRAIEKTEALIAAKEKRKKALMQQLLTGKRRFGEFAGQEWHTAPLGKLFAEVKRVVGNRDIPPYSITAGVGLVSQKEKWGKDIAGRQYSKYTILKPGEFSYNKGNSKKYACGCAYLSREPGEICVPNVFISFRPRKESVCVGFYQQWFIADCHARELKRYITSGARSDGLLNLNKMDFFKIKVPYPSFKEQAAIAAALLAADKEVETFKAKMAALKAQKRGLMQQLLTGKTRVKVDA